jgi:GTP-binding protein
MLPIVAIVGRPNVGKSTLFNRLTRSRSAIVADTPGVTRDRQYGRGRLGDRPYLVIDTGGFEADSDQPLLRRMAGQALEAITESDAVIFLVDRREGLTHRDREIAQMLRASGRKIWLTVNKAEGANYHVAAAEFHELGLGSPHPVSASHGDGVTDLMEAIIASFPEGAEEGPKDDRARVAIVGRPNAGKSTLVNALLGEDRVIAFDEPGTTRDSIYIDFERRGRKYTLIDTAGLRRRARVTDAIEKFSAIKTMQALEDANVAILLVDAQAGVTDQDAHVGSYIQELGRATVVAVNKWDGLDNGRRGMIRQEVEHKLRFLSFARCHYISARAGSGLDPLMRSVDEAYKAAFARLPTPKLTRAVREAIEAMPPPRRASRRPKPRYAHQGGNNPPIVIIHGTGVDDLSDSYRRYLENRLREQFDLTGTPLRIEFRRAGNPYDKNRD